MNITVQFIWHAVATSYARAVIVIAIMTVAITTMISDQLRFISTEVLRWPARFSSNEVLS